jgi:hypothetical protein
MTLIPIKTFEEMNGQERREYLEGLIEDYVIADEDGNAVPTEEFLTEVPVDEILKYRRRSRQHPKDPKRDYFKPTEIAAMAGLSRDTISRMFWNDPGVKKTVHAGRNHKKYVTMLISRQAVLRRFPSLAIA